MNIFFFFFFCCCHDCVRINFVACVTSSDGPNRKPALVVYNQQFAELGLVLCQYSYYSSSHFLFSFMFLLCCFVCMFDMNKLFCRYFLPNKSRNPFNTGRGIPLLDIRRVSQAVVDADANRGQPDEVGDCWERHEVFELGDLRERHQDDEGKRAVDCDAPVRTAVHVWNLEKKKQYDIIRQVDILLRDMNSSWARVLHFSPHSVLSIRGSTFKIARASDSNITPLLCCNCN